MQINLITVGKLKNSSIQTLEIELLKRLHLYKTTLIELKAHGDDIQKESLEIENKLNELRASKANTLLLSEHGKNYDSLDFSKLIEEFHENSTPTLNFVIAGASGFKKDFLNQYRQISLSRMTFPHEIARLLFIEQIYRAQCIKTNHPYHK
ncbi:MAG: 23S rRNA (pseudouridine(1915)-N(3))-methyltransferase RlmH [Bacteriovoracaceae bacterium]